jgi:hypothetical protein
MRMDQETQQRRLVNLAKTITTRALALPAKDRDAFIDVEIRVFRQASTSLYQADPETQAAVLDLADKMHGWISAMIKMLESSSKRPAEI